MDYISNVNTAISALAPLQLSELDKVSLLNRQDTKYTFHIKNLPEFLESAKSSYRVLEINGKRIFKYDTLYFDTADFLLYKYHHNEKVNRLKIRFRKYVDSDLTFFEIKYKLFGTRTSKERMKVADINSELSEKNKLLIRNITFEKNDLMAKLWVYYHRITLVNMDFTERVTIDINLSYKNGAITKNMENLAIAEIKQSKASVLTPFIQMMKEKRIRPLSISKYCLGVAVTEPHIKINNFKPKLISLNKILNAS